MENIGQEEVNENEVAEKLISVAKREEEPKKKNKFLRVFFFGIAFFLCFVFGVFWGEYVDEHGTEVERDIALEKILGDGDPRNTVIENADSDKPERVNFRIFWDVWKKMDENFVDTEKIKDIQARVYGAVKGEVSALGDPYSVFMDPEETKEFIVELDGKFTGIGAELTIKDGILTVIAPIEGMPAEKAGILPGDKIIKVDGELTSEFTIDKAVKKIRGEKGTKVVLTVLHEDAETTEDIEIVRDEIDIKSVVYEKKDNDIGYVRIKGFMDDTGKEFDKIISQMLADKIKGIIVDVRSNPGGNLDVAIDVISKFIKKGEIILWEQDRNKTERAYRAKGDDVFSDLPIVVLIDQGSASASEILAGALRDVRQCKLVGEKTFGKGSVQMLEQLPDGSSLKITVAKWLTPAKQNINKKGIEPTVEIKLTLDDLKNKNDKQLQKAIEIIKEEMR